MATKAEAMAVRKQVRELTAEIARLEKELVTAKQREGIDPHLTVRLTKSQGRFERLRRRGEAERTLAHYYLEITITAGDSDVYIPLSIASGKTVAGFMYQVEGTAAGSLASTELAVRGEGVTQITVGTLRLGKIPAGTSALFIIKATVRGQAGKVYTLAFTRINYKLNVSEPRYRQYLKPVVSKTVTLA
jgi:hypothetical protein